MAPGMTLSARLAAIVDALPLRPGMRVIEIGCGPGAAARAVAERVGPSGHVLAIDRSVKAIALINSTASDLTTNDRPVARRGDAEHFELEPAEALYDLAFAIRVGVFDGRHDAGRANAIDCVRRVLTSQGRFFIDGGDPLQEIDLRQELH